MSIYQSDLKEYMLSCSVLSKTEVISIGIKLLKTLKYTHAYGILHNDIKPTNIMTSPPLPDEIYSNITLIDYGMSKMFLDPNHKHVKFSKSKKFSGTPYFCSLN